jgi:hypothetical protein
MLNEDRHHSAWEAHMDKTLDFYTATAREEGFRGGITLHPHLWQIFQDAVRETLEVVDCAEDDEAFYAALMEMEEVCHLRLLEYRSKRGF